MSNIIVPLVILLIICLIFNKPLDNLAQKLENKSNELIKKYKQKIQIKNKNNDKIMNTLAMILIMLVLIGVLLTLGLKPLIIIAAILIIFSIIEGIIKSKYRGIILAILFIGSIIICILLYVYRYDIMLYQSINKFF